MVARNTLRKTNSTPKGFSFSLFAAEWSHDGNPKAETRNPKEARNPKSEPVHPPQ
jgi:hypothetical protein